VSARAAVATLLSLAVGVAAALGAAGCGEKRNVGSTGTGAPKPPAATAPTKSY
jgi:hypothetical protein